MTGLMHATPRVTQVPQPNETAFSLARKWMDEALPFWLANGLDRRRGGYVEQLAFDGSQRDVGFKRTRVIGRQIYVFSHAAMLGRADAIEAAQHGYEFLIRNAWLGAEGGWARQLYPDGGVKDPTPDLYDLAFVLFAFGWFYRATREPAALEWAIKTLDFVNIQMRPAAGTGFLVEKPACGPRLQNPHMHLLEAALVNLEASGDERFRKLADEIVDLFTTRFFECSTSTLGEYFDNDWNRYAGLEGRIVEPGHQFEWAWILAFYERLTGKTLRNYANSLTRFAETHGVEPDRALTFNTVLPDGRALDRGSRVWPNTERIQAAVAMFELYGEDPRNVFASSTRVLFDQFLDRGLPGTWIDRFDADGKIATDHVPASTLYHVMIAFAEMLRIEGALGSVGSGMTVPPHRIVSQLQRP